MAASGGRRFILTLGCGIVCTLLLLAGKLPPEIYRDLILGTVAVFIAGNTYQQIKTPPDPPPPPPPEPGA